MYRKIIAVFMAFMVVATTLVSPVLATDYQSTYNFWNWLYDNSWFVGKSISSLADSVCSVSDDGLHHATVPSGGFGGGDRDGVRTYTCVCDYCAQEFEATATNLENTYNDWDAVRGYDTVDSNGAISGFGEWYFYRAETYYASYGLAIDSLDQLRVHVEYNPKYDGAPNFYLAYRFSVPVNADVVFDGSFQVKNIGADDYVDCFMYFAQETGGNIGQGTLVDNKRTFSATAGGVYLYRANKVTVEKGVSGDVYFKLPRIYVELNNPASSLQEIPVFSVGDVAVDLSEYDSWAFDYTTRTFTGYTEDGDVKIVYGDENVTVIEGGNTYNYYYASPSSGGDGSGGGSGSGDGSGDGSGGDGLLGKLGELLGTFLGGIIELITGVLNRILDSLITLAEMTLEKLGNIVNLFGSFGDALRSLWSWLPADVIEVLVAGVTVIVFCAVIKLFV